MKIKGSVIVILVISVILLGVSAGYFKYVNPFLNFMFNSLPQGEKHGASVISIEGDVIDPSAYKKNEKNPQATYAPQPTVNPEQLGTFGELREQTYVDFALSPDARNILILGTDEAAALTDTIFIASIDQKSNRIQIISIPRDTYVIYDDKIINVLKSTPSDAGSWYDNKGSQKINLAMLIGNELLDCKGKFDNSGINFLSSIIEQMLGESFHIDDYVYVDFDGFMEMVEVFGGIWITTDEVIYNQYGQVLVPKGRNFLSPKEALFYVRTRKRFDENGQNLGSAGDSYRKELQVNFIKEMMQQYVNKDMIEKAPEILNSLSNSVYHSVNSVEKLSYYTKVATDYANKKYYIDFLVITGEVIDPFNDNASYVQIIKMD